MTPRPQESRAVTPLAWIVRQNVTPLRQQVGAAIRERDRAIEGLHQVVRKLAAVTDELEALKVREREMRAELAGLRRQLCRMTVERDRALRAASEKRIRPCFICGYGGRCSHREAALWEMRISTRRRAA